MAKSALTVSEPVLEAADRCDRCGQQAKSKVTLRTGVLYFCGHCFKKHSEALVKVVQVPRSL